MRRLTIGLIFGVTGLSLACGNPVAKVREAAERQRQMNDLKELGLAIHNFHDQYSKTPKSIDELDQAGVLMNPDVVGQIRSGQITVIWGFKLQPSYQLVIAFRPTNGNNLIVLLGDGSVRLEPQAAFASLTKAVPSLDKDSEKPKEDK